MFQNRVEGTFELVGIVSMGRDCSEGTNDPVTTKGDYDYYYDATTKAPVVHPGRFGIYSAVPKFVKWIRNNSNYLGRTISEWNFILLCFY